MNMKTKSTIGTSIILRLALAGGLLLPTPLVEAGQARHERAAPVPAALLKTVRNATKQYHDVNAAISAGYGPFLGCVSGPDHGAMGVHYINGPLVADGLIDATEPEALIYEPADGQLNS